MTSKLTYASLCAFVVLCHVLLFWSSCSTEAHADEPFTLAEVRVARLVVHEAGFLPGDDLRAITHVVRARAERLDLDVEDYVGTYHPQATFGPTHRVWVNALDASLLMPAGWPEQRVPWAHYRQRWLTRLRGVRAALADPRNGCRAYTWGAPTIIRARMDRMIANGWRRVDCGHTLNEYLQVPARNP